MEEGFVNAQQLTNTLTKPNFPEIMYHEKKKLYSQSRINCPQTDGSTDSRSNSATDVVIYRIAFMAIPVAYGWAGALFEVTRIFAQEQRGQ